MPIFRVKSVKIYTGQKKFTRICSWGSWQISGMISMFSMCAELTPRAPIPDSRIAQFMQPCLSTPQPSGCKRLPRWFLDTFIRRGFHRLDAYTVKAVKFLNKSSKNANKYVQDNCITCANSLWFIHASWCLDVTEHKTLRSQINLSGMKNVQET